MREKMQQKRQYRHVEKCATSADDAKFDELAKTGMAKKSLQKGFLVKILSEFLTLGVQK
jgi:hypothetical protein